ncbi:ATP-binding protein [Mycoplasma mycoides]|uniref:ATP-binding protein n=1 Tax=Mycoplasma mycoides TaxID=2102 RepID=UPI00044FF5E4|nr:ATP-binding protein [Mycoplasma mycoides]EXU60344.1 hypothetical protein MMC_5900 [Mycoplasma mycoides subsp. capri PG3]QVK04263.1 ATP-binding protein [Mycoplasma mycoides subsp. capri]
MIINRDFYLNQLINKMNNNKIKIITGIRRCGKSFLLFNLFYKYLISINIPSDQIIKISLDGYDNRMYRTPTNLNNFIKSKITNKNKKYYLLIDEIQYCEPEINEFAPNTEKITFVDVLLSFYNNPNLDVYVTGSNSKMLSTDILTQFRGRGDEISLNTLSFFEIYELFENKDKALKHYMLYGGLPAIYNLKTDEEKQKYLKNTFDETYIKDILERNSLTSETGEILDTLLNFISSAIGSLTNPLRLANRFMSEKNIKINSTTISKYLNIFKESFLIRSSIRYDVKGNKYFNTPLKYYFTDIGLRNAKLSFRQYEENHIMENIIYNELYRRDFNIDIGIVEIQQNKNNKRTRTTLEIDFIASKNHQKYYIQSAYSIWDSKKKEQETRPLNNVNDSFKKIVVVYEDIIPWHDNDGIYYVGLKEFLLDESILNN